MMPPSVAYNETLAVLQAGSVPVVETSVKLRLPSPTVVPAAVFSALVRGAAREFFGRSDRLPTGALLGVFDDYGDVRVAVTVLEGDAGGLPDLLRSVLLQSVTGTWVDEARAEAARAEALARVDQDWAVEEAVLERLAVAGPWSGASGAATRPDGPVRLCHGVVAHIAVVTRDIGLVPVDDLHSVLGNMPDRAEAQNKRDARFARPGLDRLDVGEPTWASVGLGWRLPPRGDASYPAAHAAVHVLGGHVKSRLMRRLRDDLGWSYSPWAAVRSTPASAWCQVLARVPSRHVDEAVDVILREVLDLGHVGPRAGELEQALRHCLGAQRLAMASQAGLCAIVNHYQYLGQGTDGPARWARSLTAVTDAEVQAAAQTFLRPELVAGAIASGEAGPPVAPSG